MNENKYMGTSEAAKKWGLKPETVAKLCREGKIAGAEQDGKRQPWRIPINTSNPSKKGDH